MTVVSSGSRRRSQARHLAALRGFHRFLITEKVVEKDPTEDLDTPRSERRLPSFSVVSAALLLSALVWAPYGLTHWPSHVAANGIASARTRWLRSTGRRTEIVWRWSDSTPARACSPGQSSALTASHNSVTAP